MPPLSFLPFTAPALCHAIPRITPSFSVTVACDVTHPFVPECSSPVS